MSDAPSTDHDEGIAQPLKQFSGTFLAGVLRDGPNLWDTDLTDLRIALSWMGLATPPSQEELALDWDRYVRRLIRSVAGQARRADAMTEARKR